LSAVVADAAAVAESLLRRGWYRAPGVVNGDMRDALLAAPFPFRRSTPVIGPVRQDAMHLQIALEAAPAAARDLGSALEEVRREVARCDGAEFDMPFNEVVWQKYPAGSSGISRHRDQDFYVGVIAIVTLTGSAAFALDDAQWETEPGDLVLLRGTGPAGAHTRCPRHSVGGPVGAERVSLTLRCNRNGFQEWDD
jgi:hypothetical protein